MIKIKGNGLKIGIFILCLVGGFFLAKIYQPQGKTYRIYKQAVRDYENKNYSNSYFLFSKIGWVSDLKPYAIYRQSMCAKALGDKKSELESYQRLFKYFPHNKLSAEAKYQAAQLLVEQNPTLALKYFNEVEKSNLSDDYQIAIKYYIARITASQIRYSHKKISNKKFQEIEQSYRNYLEKVPDGRLAPSVATSWLKFNPKINTKDLALIIEAYYNSKLYDDAKEIIEKTKIEDIWAIASANYFEQHNYTKTKELVELGVEKYSDNVTQKMYNLAVDKYLDLYDPNDKLRYTIKLLERANGSKKAYLWNLKCNGVSPKDKYSCYKDLYLNFPNSDYAQNALLHVFQYGIKNKDYSKCRQLAQDFIKKYPNSENIPYILFWAGKIEQSYGSSKYKEYYESLIDKYPDSYYAYRAFLILRGIHSAVLGTNIIQKPVEYPYKYPTKGDYLYSLLQVKDYLLISKISQDEFINSWVEYEKGNYLNSVTIAKKAMDEIQAKPIKSDLRWRLVYPQNYYKQISNYSQKYNNDEALMLAIVRTESTFNSEAQSGVGAIGLMQLMPSTAHDIGSKEGLTFNTSYLFNPELNIRLGNLYYSTIKKMLDNKDVSAVAAYNGGIGAVTNWKTSLNYNDTDEFVEQIPYEETRNYVERVFQSYWNYIRIYQK